MPDGPTGREWGDLTRELQEVRHDLRTVKQIAVSLTEQLTDLEMEIVKMKTKINTTLSVCAIIVSALAFLVTSASPYFINANK